MLEISFVDYKKISVLDILQSVLEKTKNWSFADKIGCAWFRGQDVDLPPNPSLFRKDYDEFNFNTTFRNRATALKEVPETERIDKWLFLMQHYGAPTRLLDWTESLLYALFFALDNYINLCSCKKNENNPTLWAIHPYKLNEFSFINYFPNTWSRFDKKIGDKILNTNTGIEHFRLAFHPKNQWDNVINKEIVKYPIAVNSNYLDMRILSQRSCFTIHGINEKDFVSLFEDTKLVKHKYFIKFLLPGEKANKLLNELHQLGIYKTNLFPDLEHLANELKQRF